MHEHRLIERLLKLVAHEVEHIESGQQPDSDFIDQAVDFFRIYADRCHHGKEEEILFRELAKKPLSPGEQKELAELMEEHVQGRFLVRAISETNLGVGRHDNTVSVKTLVSLLRQLIDFYPLHIAKEDKHFFHPIMSYFSRQEMDAMLQEFDEFDRQMIHEKYTNLVSTREDAQN
nr:hemerythrin domain-containing protein [Fundidesulfovibrio soli]